MSFWDKLLDGVEVEWKALGDIGGFIRGKRFVKTDMISEGVPCIHYGEMYTHYGIWADESKSFVDEALAAKLRVANFGDVVIVAAGETIEDIGNGTAWLGENDVVIHDACFSYKSDLDPKYVSYFLRTNTFKEQIKKSISSGKISAINANGLSKAEIPIPCPENPQKSLEIQTKIVRILDAFTSMAAELAAELSTRKKQYNYYRDQLLSFEEDEVEWKTLIEACDYVDYRGKTPTKTQEGIFLVTAKNIRMGYIDYEVSQEFIADNDYASVMRRGFPKLGDVLITTEAPCGFVAQVDRENIALAQRVIKYRSKDKRLSNSFLKHYLLGSQFQKKLQLTATGSTVKGIKGSKLHQLTIPIPSKEKQERIVTLLDKFDALTNSITEGLPREIDLRQKQFKYYRDLLFSFPKKEEVDG